VKTNPLATENSVDLTVTNTRNYVRVGGVNSNIQSTTMLQGLTETPNAQPSLLRRNTELGKSVDNKKES
jgi:hypothetical protein